jgi:hypothetical protein
MAGSIIRPNLEDGDALRHLPLDRAARLHPPPAHAGIG